MSSNPLTIPIAFAFDNNLAQPAAVCIYSLLASARPETRYDIYILYPEKEPIDRTAIDRVIAANPRHSISYVAIGDDRFGHAYEIRGITTPAYYRLLIPELLPQFDRVIYSDVDVIFRQDLSDLYRSTDMTDSYIAGVNDLAFIHEDLRRHYQNHLGLNPRQIVCSGFLIMNCEAIRRDGLVARFLEESKNDYKFQDQDILNKVCEGHVLQLPPKYSVLTYVTEGIVNRRQQLLEIWSEKELDEAETEGNVHYNGQKPWRDLCLNFDLWWQYYRQSPIYDRRFYYDFYADRLNPLDRLSLKKRLKILARYFIYGKR